MILADVRTRLGRDDARLVIRLLASAGGRDRASLEARLADEGLAALLDDPALLGALVRSPQAVRASLPLTCYVLVRHALRQAGLDDRAIADYVAAVLLPFGLRGRAHRLSEQDDELYDSLVALCAAVESGDPRRSFLARVHLGNYALWLSGLFPDHIEQRRWRRGGPDLGYYETLGRRGYRLAADHRLSGEYGMSTLYGHAADAFPRLRRALNALSDTLLFPHVQTPERVMRQVRDDVLLRLGEA